MTAEQVASTEAGRPAGFWIRLVAYIIDAIVLGVIVAVLVVPLIAIMGGDTSGMEAMSATEVNPVSNLISFGVGVIYYGAFLSSAWQATPGKRVVGIYVRTADGRRLSFLHAIGRYLAYFVSAIILLIGFIMIAFTDEKKGLHDMIAGTRVVWGRP